MDEVAQNLTINLDGQRNGYTMLSWQHLDYIWHSIIHSEKFVAVVLTLAAFVPILLLALDYSRLSQ